MYKKLIYMMILFVVVLAGCKNSEAEDQYAKDTAEKETLAAEKEEITLKLLGIRGLEEEIDNSEEKRKETYPKEVNKDGLEYKVEYLNEDLMSARSVRLTVVPIDSLDIEKVEYVRPGEKAVGIEETEIDGEKWYKVETKGEVGWGPAKHLKPFSAKKVVARLNNSGSPFSSEIRPPNSVFTDEGELSYVIFEEKYDNLKGMEKEDEFFYIWGGTEDFDMFDSKNTHFVVKKGNLKGIEDSKKIKITDNDAGIFHYIKEKEYEVDSRGIGVEDGVDYWDEITAKGEDERATFQVTEDFKTSKIIVFVPDYNLD